MNLEGVFHGEPVPTAAEVQERGLQKLCRRMHELEEENDFLKKCRILCKEPAVKYTVIEHTAGKVSVRKTFRMLKVHMQRYFEYQSRKGSPQEVRNRCLAVKIKNIFYARNRIYRSRKIRAELRKRANASAESA